MASKKQRKSTLKAKEISKCHFWCYYGDSSFGPLKNQKTVLGVHLADKRIVIKESSSKWSISNKVQKTRRTHNVINCILVNEELNSLMTGHDGGTLTIHDLTTFETQKIIDNMETGDIVSATRFGPISVFGGWKRNRLRVVLLNQKAMFGYFLNTSVNYLSSLRFCVVDSPLTLTGKRVLICVSGYDSEGETWTTDVFDASLLVDYFQKKYAKEARLVDFGRDLDGRAESNERGGESEDEQTESALVDQLLHNLETLIRPQLVDLVSEECRIRDRREAN